MASPLLFQHHRRHDRSSPFYLNKPTLAATGTASSSSLLLIRTNSSCFTSASDRLEPCCTGEQCAHAEWTCSQTLPEPPASCNAPPAYCVPSWAAGLQTNPHCPRREQASLLDWGPRNSSTSEPSSPALVVPPVNIAGSSSIWSESCLHGNWAPFGAGGE